MDYDLKNKNLFLPLQPSNERLNINYIEIYANNFTISKTRKNQNNQEE